MVPAAFPAAFTSSTWRSSVGTIILTLLCSAEKEEGGDMIRATDSTPVPMYLSFPTFSLSYAATTTSKWLASAAAPPPLSSSSRAGAASGS